jgi:dTDP-4-amino-4,6-dideoxygalactose transaminase
MSKNKIWLSSPHMGGTEQEYIKEAFDSNWIAPLGPNVSGFEKDLEEYLSNNSKVAALSSGTGAIHLALIQLGVKQGDEVLCQSLTFSASANPITYLGAKPIFIDSETSTWNMDAALLEKAIKERLKQAVKPKAILVVHLYGMPAQMDKITAISMQYDIPIIEDAAEALGSTYKNKKCGSLGKFGILSFNGNKIITTSGGGALICNDEKSKLKTIFLATQARDKAPHYQHSEIGYNYRMSNIVAGIGRGQMKVIEQRVNQRRANNTFYRKELIAYDQITFIKEAAGFYSNYWLTTILTDSFKTREKIRIRLEKDNIEARPLWKPMHLQPVFKNYQSFTNGVSEDLFNRGLCLPSGSNLSNDDLQRIILSIHKSLKS